MTSTEPDCTTCPHQDCPDHGQPPNMRSRTDEECAHERMAEALRPLVERIERLERRSRAWAIAIMQAGVFIAQEVRAEPSLPGDETDEEIEAALAELDGTK